MVKNILLVEYDGIDIMTKNSSISEQTIEPKIIPGEISNTISTELDELVEVRERVLQKTRKIIQLSSKIINDIHNSKSEPAHVKELRKMVQELVELTAGHPRITHAPYVDSALGEYCEAMLFRAIVNNEKIPSPNELSVNSIPYLLGMGDVVGELRRYILGYLKDNDTGKALLYYQRMESVYDFLAAFHYPKAVVDIRRKKDVARSLLEKTLGELVVARSNHDLSERMKEFGKIS